MHPEQSQHAQHFTVKSQPSVHPSLYPSAHSTSKNLLNEIWCGCPFKNHSVILFVYI